MIKRLDRWIFGFGSPVTLGVYRAIMGTLVFIGLLLVGADFQTWFTEGGLAPAKAAAMWEGTLPHFNLLNGVTSPEISLAFFILVVIASVLTAFGLFTRVSTIALALGIITLHHRDPFILNGGDTMMRLSVVYLALAPCGAAFSLDRRRLEAKHKPTQDSVSLWPQRLIQVQMVLMYGTTVWHKLNGLHWIDGTASWYPTKLIEFDRFPLPQWIDLPPFVQFFTWSTLLVEMALASLVFWKPARKWVLLCGILLHATIEYRFNIPMFAFICVAQYLTHYEGGEVQGWLDRTKKRLSGKEGQIATA